MRLKHYGSDYGFAPPFIWTTDYAGLANGCVLHEDILDLGGVDVLPAGDDHVALARDDIQVAFGIEMTDVARMVPAIAQGPGGRLRRIPIAQHNVRTAYQDFAILARRDVAPVVVDYALAGPAFETASKPGYGPEIGRKALAEIARVARVPVLAIGGINAARVGEVIAAGAAGVAVMGGVMRAADPAQEVRALIATLKGSLAIRA